MLSKNKRFILNNERNFLSVEIRFRERYFVVFGENYFSGDFRHARKLLVQIYVNVTGGKRPFIKRRMKSANFYEKLIAVEVNSRSQTSILISR